MFKEVERSNSKFNISKNTLHTKPQQYDDITESIHDYYDVVKTWGKPDISLGVKQIKCITQNP